MYTQCAYISYIYIFMYYVYTRSLINNHYIVLTYELKSATHFKFNL